MSKIGKSCLFLCLLALSLVSITPSVLSTNWGTSWVLGYLNQKIPGRIQLADANFSWFRQQNFKNITLSSPSLEPILTIKQIDIDASLLSLLWNIENFNTLRVQDANVKIVQDENGVTDLQHALGLQKTSEGPFKTPVFVENANLEIRQGDDDELITQATGTTRQNDLKGQFSLDVFLKSQGDQKFTLRASHFPTLVLDQTLAISQPHLAGLLLNAFGESLEISIDQDSNSAFNFLQMTAKSPYIDANYKGTITLDKLAIEPGGSLRFSIPNDNIRKISTLLKMDPIEFTNVVEGSIENKAITVTLDPDAIHDMDGEIDFNFMPNQVLIDSEIMDITTLHVKAKAEKNTSKISVNTEIEANEQGDPIQFNLALKLPKHAFITTNLDMLMGEGVDVAGNFKSQTPSVNATWEGVLRETHSELMMSLATDNITIPKLTISIPFIPFQEAFEDGEILSIIQGTASVHQMQTNFPLPKADLITIPWTLDLKGNSAKLNIMAKKNQNDVEDNIKGSLRIDKFMNEGDLDLHQAALQLNLKLTDIDTEGLQPYVASYPIKRIVGSTVVADVTLARSHKGAIDGCVEFNSGSKKSEAFVKRVMVKFALQNDNRDITFESEAHQAIGAAFFSGTLHHLFNDNGAFDLEQAYISLQGNLKHFPVGIIAKVLTGDSNTADTMEAVLGTQVEGDVYAVIKDRQGPVKVQLKGLNGQFALDGKIVDEVLFLNESLTASLKVTPQLEHAVLREYLPLLGSAISAEKPIELSIPKEGFQLPLKNPSLQNLQFKIAELKLDKIQFHKESPLGKIVSVLGVETDKFEVWFTPIYFSMENGLIRMSRTDMLIANIYPIASWGTVDLGAQQMDLIVALSGAALKKSFGLEGLSDNGWLQIPIRGDTHHPKIDLATVTARIAALGAISKAGPPGKLIGAVIESATDIVGLDKAPPSTTNPLPWQHLFVTSSYQSIEENLEKPVNDLKKGAKKLLKGLFQ